MKFYQDKMQHREPQPGISTILPVWWHPHPTNSGVQSFGILYLMCNIFPGYLSAKQPHRSSWWRFIFKEVISQGRRMFSLCGLFHLPVLWSPPVAWLCEGVFCTCNHQGEKQGGKLCMESSVMKPAPKIARNNSSSI